MILKNILLTLVVLFHKTLINYLQLVIEREVNFLLVYVGVIEIKYLKVTVVMVMINKYS